MDELSSYENNGSMSSSEDTISDESESITENIEEDTGTQDTNSAIYLNKDGKKQFIYHCKSHEEALQYIKKYELATTTRFVVFKANKNFGATEILTKTHNVLWDDFAMICDDFQSNYVQKTSCCQ
ncbi:uncharacterized protein LOC124816849 [Hydra vulgaris]|uniref:uncharacterized protein LOC124816849 n=1 Tax=Hydra vulgaris TaxID=6087 RepID=UPI001F5FBE69|nr:uncharacterized protein LOC124816849 [Hydra vulgaris]